MGTGLTHGGTVTTVELRSPLIARPFDAEGRVLNVPYSKHLPVRITLRQLPAIEVNGQVLAR